MVEEAQEALQKECDKNMKACQAKINAALKEHGCTMIVRHTIQIVEKRK